MHPFAATPYAEPMSTLPPFMDLPPAPEAPPEPKSVRTAVLLALFLGPLGLFYVSAFAGLLMTFVTVVAGFFTMGIGVFLAWPVCVVWAYAATHGHEHDHEPSTSRAHE